MRANENKLEKVGKVLLEILEGCFYLVKSQPSIVFIWLNLSHLLIVSEVLYQEVIVLWWLQKNFFCLIFKLFALGIFWHGFTVSSYQRPLYWQRINNSYSTIRDRILDVIFLIVQRTFLLSYYWVILEVAGSQNFFCVLQVCGHKMKWPSSWLRLFSFNDYHSMAISFVTKLNFWQRKR